MIKETTQQLLARMATEIAENEQKVFAAGYEMGQEEADTSDAYNEGYEVGLEQGKQAEYDAFWDAFQTNGTRTDYHSAFYCWESECFKPKYFSNIEKAQNMFYTANMLGNEYIKRLDFSKCVNFIQTFSNCKVEELGVIDASQTKAGYGITGIFSSAKKLRKIEKFIFPTDSNVVYNYPFNACESLTDITIGSTIYKTISFEWCPLSRASIESIFLYLDEEYHGEARSATFSKVAVDKAFETSEGANDGSTSLDWLVLLTTIGEDYGKWTISLI